MKESCPISPMARPTPERLLVLLLHAHLPDCRRPGLSRSLEETWFFQALTESYLPLIRLLDRLRDDGIPVRLTLSLSPTLLDQLRDPNLALRWKTWLSDAQKIALHDAETGPASLRPIATWHAAMLSEIDRFREERCLGDPLEALLEHVSQGRIELATTCATHAFLPAHQGDSVVAKTQIRAGLASFRQHTGRCPEFFWLPECGYYPGLEEMLARAGIRGFGLESHGITQARPAPAGGARTALRCPNGVMAFGRDTEASRLVWSAEHGYPGHPDYREFHRDRIHEVPREALRALIGTADPRLPSGLKYWRITGPTDQKDLYNPENAVTRAHQHAADFVEKLFPENTRRANVPSTPEICFLPFDAELFGHWWFEGPVWLESLFRYLAENPRITPVTASEAIRRCSAAPSGLPAPSSWGAGGDYSHWINRDTDWLYPQLHDAELRFRDLLNRLNTEAAPPNSGSARAARRPSPNTLRQRTLLQAGRTLLLLQASDWPFMITSGTLPDLAATHLNSLFSSFERLCDDLENNTVCPDFLEACERADSSPAGLTLDCFDYHH